MFTMDRLIFALACLVYIAEPCSQSVVPPASCSITRSPFQREQCGADDIHESSCLRLGCCFDNSYENTYFCYRPVNCLVGEVKSRQECGWEGISRSACECRGCCFDESTTSCFKPYPQIPTQPPTTTTPEPTKPPEPECVGKKMDLIFCLDESTSIDSDEFKKLIAFAKGVTEKLHVGPDATQVGMITYSSSPDTRFTLRNHHTQLRVVKAIEKIRQRGGSTYTHTAIDSIVEYMKPIHGGRPDAMKVAIIETDGASKNKTATKESADRAKAAGITLVAAGVGDFNKQEVEDIASEPKKDHMFQLEDFDKLVEHIRKITLAACKGTPPPTETTLEPVTKPSNVPRMCEFVAVAERTKVNYMIDPDGPNKGADPFMVECDFTTDPPTTILHNAQEKEVCVTDCEERDRGCFVQTIQYNASPYQTRTYVNNAKSCVQYMKFSCMKSAVGYRAQDKQGAYTYWTNKKGEKMPYWAGGPSSGGCACAKSGTCHNAAEKCNCDSKANMELSDEGIITDMAALPVKEVAIGDVSKPGQKGCFTLGPLKCI